MMAGRVTPVPLTSTKSALIPIELQNHGFLKRAVVLHSGPQVLEGPDGAVGGLEIALPRVPAADPVDAQDALGLVDPRGVVQVESNAAVAGRDPVVLELRAQQAHRVHLTGAPKVVHQGGVAGPVDGQVHQFLGGCVGLM